MTLKYDLYQVMRKGTLLLTVSLALLHTVASSQGVTRQQVDSMVHALDKNITASQRIDLLLNLAQFHILKPGEFQVDFDSARMYIDQAKALNTTLGSSDAYGYELVTESLLIKEKGQRNEARKMVEKAVEILEPGTNKSYLGSAIYELSSYYDYTNKSELAKRIQLVEQSVKLFQQTNDRRKEARALEVLGDLYEINEEDDKAIVVLQQALTAYAKVKHQYLQGIYVILGAAYRDKEDFGQSLFYLLKALKTAHTVGDSSMQLCNINNHLAALYGAIGRYEMAGKYAEDALRIARKHNDEYAIFFGSINTALKYNHLGRPDRAVERLSAIPKSYISTLGGDDREYIDEGYLRSYLSLKQYDKAYPHVVALLKWAETSTITLDINTINRLAATYYLYTNQLTKARFYLTKNYNYVTSEMPRMGRINDSEIWYKLDSAESNFQSAFKHLLFYKTNMDSILSDNRVRQLQVLGVEYEIALKEDSMKLKDKNIQLLTQENNLQAARLQRANMIKNVTVGAIALAFVIIGLLYRLYRQKQKSNGVITQKNELLQHFLKEKEWLLKEIHHRVKNNLQIVMSLLNSQSAYIDNVSALTAIHDSQHRVHAISLIHQKLYNAQNVSSIDMSFYIRELVSYLTDCFNTGQRIRFDLDIDRLEMDVSQAVPLGLILNEAITNAIKYAFPDGRMGAISISLVQCDRSGQFMLKISDDGIGMPPRLNSNRPGSLGLSLIAGLSEDLDGSFSIESKNGTSLRVTFVHEPGDKRTNNIIDSLAHSV